MVVTAGADDSNGAKRQGATAAAVVGTTGGSFEGPITMARDLTLRQWYPPVKCSRQRWQQRPVVTAGAANNNSGSDGWRI